MRHVSIHQRALGAMTICCTVLFLTGCAGSTVAGDPAPAGQVIRAEDMRFQRIAPFVEMATVSGDRTRGRHGTFGVFKAAAASPPHTHSVAYHGVVLRGRMVNPFDGEVNPPEMGPGSYWFVPAGAVHVTACVSDEPCLFYFHADGAFDFTPVGQ